MLLTFSVKTGSKGGGKRAQHLSRAPALLLSPSVLQTGPESAEIPSTGVTVLHFIHAHWVWMELVYTCRAICFPLQSSPETQRALSPALGISKPGAAYMQPL